MAVTVPSSVHSTVLPLRTNNAVEGIPGVSHFLGSQDDLGSFFGSSLNLDKLHLAAPAVDQIIAAVAWTSSMSQSLL